MNHQATVYTYNLHLSISHLSIMVIVVSIYFRFYSEVSVGVSTFLPTATRTPKISSHSKALLLSVF
jgi:hypothetical protein